MSRFHAFALLALGLWVALVAARYRRSAPVLTGGLLLVGASGLAALALGEATPRELGFAHPRGWLERLALAAGWCGLMLAVSPLADRIASRFFAEPPRLDAFRALRESRAKLLAGVAIAWLLGGFFEELVLRGMALGAVEALAAPWLGPTAAAGLGVLAAAAAALVLHLYQGPRAALIVAQLSVLFGVLFVASGHDLWVVVLCHGFYDTVAFVRFARRKSRDSELEATGSAGRA